MAKKKARRKTGASKGPEQGRPAVEGTSVNTGAPPASVPTEPAASESGTLSRKVEARTKPDWRSLIFPAVLMVISLTILIRGAFIGKTSESQATAGERQTSAVPVNLTLPEEGIQTLSPPVWLAAMKKVGSADSVILDVRTPGEVASGRISPVGYEFLNLDFYDPSFDRELNRLDKEKTYFVYCSTGYRSGQVLHRMKALGFKRAFGLSGGIVEFQRSGLSANF